jgi:hypothetical protein
VRHLWRDRSTLQLGRLPGRVTVLAGLDPASRAVLGLLDGARDAQQVVAAAGSVGCPPDRARALLELLAEAGVLQDGGSARAAPAGWTTAERDRFEGDLTALSLVREDPTEAVRRRAAARVTVAGAGRVGAPLAALLGAAGVGGVDVRDDAVVAPQDVGVGGLHPDDVGRRRGEAARAHLRARWPRTDVSVQPDADLVVLAPTGREPLESVSALVADGVPHLLAEVRDGVGVVGPLVLPGSTACLHCLDLARSDLDPAWPTLAAQLATPPRGTPACDGRSPWPSPHRPPCRRSPCSTAPSRRVSGAPSSWRCPTGGGGGAAGRRTGRAVAGCPPPGDARRSVARRGRPTATLRA